MLEAISKVIEVYPLPAEAISRQPACCL